MSFLNFLTGTAGYTAILAAFGLAVAAHFFAPREWGGALIQVTIRQRERHRRF